MQATIELHCDVEFLIPYIRHSSVHISARADRCDISRNTTGGPLTYDHELPEQLAISLARAPATVALFGRIYCCQQRRQSQHTPSRQVRHTLSCIAVFVHAHTYWHVPHCPRTIHSCNDHTPYSLDTVHANYGTAQLKPLHTASTCTPRQYVAAPCAIRYNLHYWHAPTHTLLFILCVAVHVKYGTPLLCAY